MNVVVLVGSHDRYSAAWPPFCYGLHKYWPDRPWPVKFITNYRTAPCGHSLRVGGDRDWGTNTLRALELIEAPVILWMLEDIWLTEPPDTEALKDFAEIVLSGQADHIRLYSSWKGGQVRAKGLYEPDSRLKIFAHNSRYRASCSIAFWNVEVYKKLLRENETIWEFERDAERTQTEEYRDRFLCVRRHEYMRFVMHTRDQSYKSPWSAPPIVKGKWTKAAQIYAEQEGLPIDFSRHPDGTEGDSDENSRDGRVRRNRLPISTGAMQEGL